MDEPDGVSLDLLHKRINETVRLEASQTSELAKTSSPNLFHEVDFDRGSEFRTDQVRGRV